jgi:hypothetical protein
LMLCFLLVRRRKKKESEKWLGAFFLRAGHALLVVPWVFCGC